MLNIWAFYDDNVFDSFLYFKREISICFYVSRDKSVVIAKNLNKNILIPTTTKNIKKRREMSGDGQNINSILLELETAIKNSYMSEFENFIRNDDDVLLTF